MFIAPTLCVIVIFEGGTYIAREFIHVGTVLFVNAENQFYGNISPIIIIVERKVDGVGT